MITPEPSDCTVCRCVRAPPSPKRSSSSGEPRIRRSTTCSVPMKTTAGPTFWTTSTTAERRRATSARAAGTAASNASCQHRDRRISVLHPRAASCSAQPIIL